MTEASQTGLSHPLVAAYLDDLDRALASADPRERLDTVTAVTEHLTDALGDDAEPTTEQVRAVLDELGSVERIADAATPASASAPPASSASETQRGQWVAPALFAVALVSLVIPFLGAVLALGCIAAAIVLLRGETPRRGLLCATIAVSIVTLLVTAFLATLTMAWSTVTVTGDTESDVVVSSQAAVAPTPGP